MFLYHADSSSIYEFVCVCDRDMERDRKWSYLISGYQLFSWSWRLKVCAVAVRVGQCVCEPSTYLECEGHDILYFERWKGCAWCVSVCVFL